MRSRDTLNRLKAFQIEEKRRRVTQLEAMIEEFTRIIKDLDREIAIEEQRTNNTDPTHYAYSTYARSTRTRRDNLEQSAQELRAQLVDAKNAFEDAALEFEKTQHPMTRTYATHGHLDQLNAM